MPFVVIVAIFFGAGGKQDRGEKDSDDDGHNHERGSNIHCVRSSSS